MEFNNKQLERTTSVINFIISFLFGVFLILLTSKIISDIDNWTVAPVVDDYKSKEVYEPANKQIEALRVKIDTFSLQRNKQYQSLEVAKTKYTTEKNSFDSWVEARKSIGSTQEDLQVRNRAVQLDIVLGGVTQLEAELRKTDNSIDSLNTLVNQQQDLIVAYDQQAYEKYYAAYRSYTIKIFFIRLAIISPILLVGIFFFLRFRKHKYWPLHRGFIFFSLYLFFIEIIPYLPSFGGYIRYTVGILLTVFGGIYAINNIRSFIERKKEELKISSIERAKVLNIDVAEKALDKCQCPSCGKGFIANTSENPENKKSGVLSKQITFFCRFCGLELFKHCKKCSTVNFAHLPFCSGCGVSQKEEV